MNDAREHETELTAPDVSPVVVAAVKPVERGLAGVALALQRTAGNRATTSWARTTSRRLQRRPRARDPSDTVGAYMDDDDWARAAWALGQLPESDMRTRIQAMDARERKYVISGARHSEPASWVDSIVTAMMGIDPRSALVGSLHWARWKHEWGRARNWFTGLSLEDGRKVARELDFKHDQLVAVIGDSAYLRLMFPDPWAFVSRAERMLRVMEMLVGTHHYPVNGAAGIVGNLMGESGLIPSRVEGSSETTPMRAADASGTQTDFTAEQVRDRDHTAGTGPKLPGVGIAQWTARSRRAGFFARPGGTGIMHDMAGQVDYLVEELHTNYSALDGRLRAATITIQDAADDVLEHFEAPADPEQSRSARRDFANKAAATYLAEHPRATAPATP